jgi:hypothetical protein
MLSRTSRALDLIVDPIHFKIQKPTVSTDSFSRQLVSALKDNPGSSVPAGGQNPGARQDLGTRPPHQNLMAPTTKSGILSTPLQAAGITPPQIPLGGTPGGNQQPVTAPGSAPSLTNVMQSFQTDWSVLTPQQVAFQLANAAGTGGGNPTDLVPGTNLTFGDLNQTQQEAYQYALNYGTGGASMQNFLTQSAGPTAAWNQSYNQIQTSPDIQSAVGPGYVANADGVPMPQQAPANEYATAPASSGNLDNLPNPALIRFLPADQQAAAEAALEAEGPYGTNIAAVANAYSNGQFA